MAESSPRVIFVDFDGTLYENYQLDPQAVAALKHAQATGHKVFLCTGRAYSTVPAEAHQLGLDGMITNGGAVARVGTEIVFEQGFSRRDLDRLLEFFTADDTPFLLQSDHAVFANQTGAAVYREYLDQAAAIHGGPVVPLPAWRPLAEADLDHVDKLVFFSHDPDKLATVQRQFGHDYFVVNGSMPWANGSSGEVGPYGISKGTGINAVLQHLGLASKDAIGIGDSYNDVEMFEACGVAVAMGNAVPELQAQADFVTTAVLAGGVWQALVDLGIC